MRFTPYLHQENFLKLIGANGLGLRGLRARRRERSGKPLERAGRTILCGSSPFGVPLAREHLKGGAGSRTRPAVAVGERPASCCLCSRPPSLQAFERLIEGHLMDSGQESEVLQGLQFGPNEQWLRLLYQCKLTPTPTSAALEGQPELHVLETKYRLRDNLQLKLLKAQREFHLHNFRKVCGRPALETAGLERGLRGLGCGLSAAGVWLGCGEAGAGVWLGCGWGGAGLWLGCGWDVAW